jgi:hypothetical protein
MPHVPPPWVIEEIEKARRGHGERARPRPELPRPQPAPAPHEDAPGSRVVVVEHLLQTRE